VAGGGLGFLLFLALGACASQQPGTPVASRDLRSLSFCSLKAQAAGYADYDVAAACRRAERAAEMRAQSTRIDPALDKACEDEATLDHAGGPFSWRAYMRCVDDSI
jgi:hypothetical protein